jgi:glycosyltransferase involved in cell wall biosynthesis
MFPIIINNRNRLTTTKNMVEHLLSLNKNQEIIILDNDSTYDPLIKWYKEVEDKIDIRYLKNEGHLAVWSTGIYKELGDYFIYTDSDLELNLNMPYSYQIFMYNLMQKYEINKIALGIKINDLPDHYRYKNQVIRNEGRWWLEEVEPDIYKADTDTTFSLMRNIGDNMYKSLRICKPDFICKHVPFYIDLENLDEEEKYYIENIGERVTTQYTKQHKEPKKYTDV